MLSALYAGKLQSRLTNTLMRQGKKFRVEKMFYDFFSFLQKFFVRNYYFFKNKKLLMSTDTFSTTYFLEREGVLSSEDTTLIYKGASEDKSLNKFFWDPESSGTFGNSLLLKKRIDVKKKKIAITEDIFIDRLVNARLLSKSRAVLLSSNYFKNYNSNLASLLVFRKILQSKHVEKQDESRSVARKSYTKGLHLSKNYTILGFYYYKLSFSLFFVLVSNFIVFQILFDLIPIMGVRMTAQKSTTKLKKKGRRRKAYGVPIALFAPAQISKAVSFFKKSFFVELRAGADKTSSPQGISFRETFIQEFIGFLLNKNTLAKLHKRKLHRSVVEFRSNYHYRWFTLKIMS